MQLDFVILCDGAAPRGDSKIDLFGAGFDTVFATRVPARHPVMYLVARFLLSRHELEAPHRVKVVLMTQDGAEIARVEEQIDALDATARAQLAAGESAGLGAIMVFDDVVFPEYGRYQFSILWDDNEERSMVLNVKQLEEEN